MTYAAMPCLTTPGVEHVFSQSSFALPPPVVGPNRRSPPLIITQNNQGHPVWVSRRSTTLPYVNRSPDRAPVGSAEFLFFFRRSHVPGLLRPPFVSSKTSLRRLTDVRIWSTPRSSHKDRLNEMTEFCNSWGPRVCGAVTTCWPQPTEVCPGEDGEGGDLGCGNGRGAGVVGGGCC